MSAGQAVLLVGGPFLILAVMIAAMIRLDINHRRRIERRREAWKLRAPTAPAQVMATTVALASIVPEALAHPVAEDLAADANV